MRNPTVPRCLMLGGLCCALMLFGTVRTQGQKINSKHPGVYLTFQRFVEKTASEAYPSEGARLVLHNNTRWPIYYGKWLEPALPGDIAMIYNLELEDGSIALRRHVEVVTSGKLLPGTTVSFTVPREDFPKSSKIFIRFDFSWELSHGERDSNEAVHRAYFRSNQLLDWP
jgi:hypothetical protein